SKEADRITLIRRLSFDLTGLPPSPSEVDAFINDKSDSSCDSLVDRLHSSPHFGERMAVYWLDLVRHADTIGYHSDTPREVYPFRDYVINSFNSNKRFNDFTREQIAGDLLATSNDSIHPAQLEMPATAPASRNGAKTPEQKKLQRQAS